MSPSRSALQSFAAGFLADRGEPVACEPRAYGRHLDMVEQFHAGTLDRDGLRAALSTDPMSRPTRTGVLGLFGLLTPGPSIFSMLGVGTNVREFTGQLRAAAADDTVKSIVVVVDSPGGSVRGIPEAAAAMRAVRGVKPVVAVVTGLGASAAYWIASNATSIVAAPSADVGSIGIIGHRVSVARQLEREGVDVAVISAGRFKAEGNRALPMTDAERAYLQRRVDELYGQFVGDVTAGRHTTPATVLGQYGEGRVLSASDAKRVGMIDDLALPEDAIARAMSMPDARAAVQDRRRDLAALALAPHRALLARAEMTQRRAQLLAATSGKGF